MKDGIRESINRLSEIVDELTVEIELTEHLHKAEYLRNVIVGYRGAIYALAKLSEETDSIAPRTPAQERATSCAGE